MVRSVVVLHFSSSIAMKRATIHINVHTTKTTTTIFDYRLPPVFSHRQTDRRIQSHTRTHTRSLENDQIDPIRCWLLICIFFYRIIFNLNTYRHAHIYVAYLMYWILSMAFLSNSPYCVDFFPSALRLCLFLAPAALPSVNNRIA